MRLGVGYSPEQWPPSRWTIDARIMSAAGLEVVRLGETAWTAWEPEPGRYDWAWLDRAIDTFAAEGLRVVLAPPTAAAPLWLTQRRPEIVKVDGAGRRGDPAGRARTCPSSPAFRWESVRVVEQWVDRYGAHDAVEAWQLLPGAAEVAYADCWCSECHEAFAAWLQRRFGTIGALNVAWHTDVEAHRYPSFEAVRLPSRHEARSWPSLRLASHRFRASATLSAATEHVAALRTRCPSAKVLVCAPAGESTVDHAALAALTGNAAHGGAALLGTEASDPYEPGIAHDRSVALAAGGEAWVIGQPVTLSSRAIRGPLREGDLRRWAWHAALHGIDTLVYRHWRPPPAGPGQHETGLVRADGSVGPVIEDVRRLADELAASARPRRGAVGARSERARRAALLSALDDDGWRAAWRQDRTSPVDGDDGTAAAAGPGDDLGLQNAYSALRRSGMEVDICPPSPDLSAYRIVLAPSLHLVDDERAELLESAMAAGTLVVLGPHSLRQTGEGCNLDEPAPGGGIAGRYGVRIGDPIGRVERVTVSIGRGHAPAVAAGAGATTLEIDETAGAGAGQVVARYRAEGASVDGCPAAVRVGPLLVVGFTSAAAWTALLTGLIGLDEPLPSGHEVFDAGGRAVRIDHHAGTITGVLHLPGDGRFAGADLARPRAPVVG